ncbi:heat shock factor binding 1 [Zalerion maritima]|uniref:Heat shock factor binding 1 n=1 Tax=Zalerion maritima TaxID=339359 RepID=A0AAD5RX32_9PEZI|nr:heat shock factor binding 1 [Zalerion maritima]
MASNENNDNSLNTSSDDARAELNAAVEELLNSLSNKFAGVSSEIFAKMDEMTRRLDNLEAAVMVRNEGSNKTDRSSR